MLQVDMRARQLPINLGSTGTERGAVCGCVCRECGSKKLPWNALALQNGKSTCHRENWLILTAIDILRLLIVFREQVESERALEKHVMLSAKMTWCSFQ